jgi:hypothetical protein
LTSYYLTSSYDLFPSTFNTLTTNDAHTHRGILIPR